MSYSLTQKLGAILYDLPRFLWSMRPSTRHPWVFLRNRDERLIADGSEAGALCDWQWTSDLHIAKVFPTLGRTLMKRALRDWPIVFQAEPLRRDESVQVSFVIGHRGIERLPHLLLTLKSIAAQREVAFECIVVEQSTSSEVKEHLPSWVRYIHTPLPYPDMPYCRAWAFNVGTRMAQGELLVLHDNDMLIPREYASELFRRFSEGHEVINLKRFIFYLAESHSAKMLCGQASLFDESPGSVVQNLEAGGSLAIARDAYFAVGGFDESFVGWGGEDNEFWERAQTRRVWPYGCFPVVHLWHSAQTEKTVGENATPKQRYWQLAAIDPRVRIRKLVGLGFGDLEGPVCDDHIVTS